MGRKKRAIPTRVTKIDADLVGRCEMLAKDQGITIGEYISKLLRPIVEREWARLIKRAAEREGGPK